MKIERIVNLTGRKVPFDDPGPQTAMFSTNCGGNFAVINQSKLAKLNSAPPNITRLIWPEHDNEIVIVLTAVKVSMQRPCTQEEAVKRELNIASKLRGRLFEEDKQELKEKAVQEWSNHWLMDEEPPSEVLLIGNLKFQGEVEYLRPGDDVYLTTPKPFVATAKISSYQIGQSDLLAGQVIIQTGYGYEASLNLTQGELGMLLSLESNHGLQLSVKDSD